MQEAGGIPRGRGYFPAPLALLPTVSHLLPEGVQPACAQHVSRGQPFSYVNLTAIGGGRFCQSPCFTSGDTEPQKLKQ